MSIRKVLLVLIIVLSSSCSSITGQIEDNPVEIYRAFEESLRGTDIQLPMSFFHEEAVFTSDTGYALEHTELTTFEGIKTEVQEWMDMCLRVLARAGVKEGMNRDELAAVFTKHIDMNNSIGKF